MKLRELRMDLHVHTCLSPCGDARMIPQAVVETAIERGLDAVCIADHNSAENVQAVISAARDTCLTVFPGMEVTTSEEAHLLAVFDGIASVLELQGRVYSRLAGINDPETFGHQWIVDNEGYVDGECQKLLFGATGFSFEDSVSLIKKLGGVAIAAHVDREAFSVVGQLGFIPPGAALDAVEVKGEFTGGQYNGLPEIRSSDAHFLDAIGVTATTFVVEAATTVEIGKALRGEEGRGVHL